MEASTIDRVVKDTFEQQQHGSTSKIILVGKEMRDFTVLRQSRFGLKGIFRHLRTEEYQLDFLVLDEQDTGRMDLTYCQASPYHLTRIDLDNVQLSFTEHKGKKYGVLKLASQGINPLQEFGLDATEVTSYLLPFMTAGELVTKDIDTAEIEKRLNVFSGAIEKMDSYVRAEEFFRFIYPSLVSGSEDYININRKEVHPKHKKCDVFSPSTLGEAEFSRKRSAWLSHIFTYAFKSPPEIKNEVGAFEGAAYTAAFFASVFGGGAFLPEYVSHFALGTSAVIRIMNHFVYGGGAGVTGSIYGVLCHAGDKLSGNKRKFML